MQTYPQYYPQMNNYGQQYNPQQPYMDRLAGLSTQKNTLTRYLKILQNMRGFARTILILKIIRRLLQ